MSRKPFDLGLIGFPLGHSYSAAIHQAAMAELRLPGNYRLLPLHPFPEGEPRLKEILLDMREGRLQGLNVTLPWKRTIKQFLDWVTFLAEQVGAVNTVYLKDGYLVGENTDAAGFLSDLMDCFPGLSPDGAALILGGGGSAYSVAHAILQCGWSVHVAARRVEQAERLRDHFQNQIGPKIPLEVHLLNVATLKHIVRNREVSLIVNCTPVGMYPNFNASPWPAEVPFPKGAVVYDLIYNPAETALIRQARHHGLASATGGGMLVEQAARAFECWFGVEAPRQAMRKALEFISSETTHGELDRK